MFPSLNPNQGLWITDALMVKLREDLEKLEIALDDGSEIIQQYKPEQVAEENGVVGSILGDFEMLATTKKKPQVSLGNVPGNDSVKKPATKNNNKKGIQRS